MTMHRIPAVLVLAPTLRPDELRHAGWIAQQWANLARGATAGIDAAAISRLRAGKRPAGGVVPVEVRLLLNRRVINRAAAALRLLSKLVEYPPFINAYFVDTDDRSAVRKEV